MRSAYNKPYICDESQDMFDDDYIALLSILSTVLQVYNINQSDAQEKQNRYMIDLLEGLSNKQDELDSRMRKLERRLERSVYNAR